MQRAWLLLALQSIKFIAVAILIRTFSKLGSATGVSGTAQS